MVSWWDREVSVWSIPKPLATKDDTESPAESVGLVGRKLVAKISLQVDLSTWSFVLIVNDVFRVTKRSHLQTYLPMALCSQYLMWLS